MIAASSSSRIGARAPVTAASSAPTKAAAISIGNRSLVAPFRRLPRRAPRTLRVAARAAAGGKAYICKYVKNIKCTTGRTENDDSNAHFQKKGDALIEKKNKTLNLFFFFFFYLNSFSFSDCGWIYVPSVEGAPFESLDRFKCPVCSAPKRRFAPYAGAAGKGVNDLATRKARKAKLAGGGGSGKDAGNRKASGEGIDSGDASKLVAGLVGGLVIVGGLYLALNANF